MSKNVIVIGGTGFLGYHAVQELLARGWSVTALGLLPAQPAAETAARSLFPAGVKVILLDYNKTSPDNLLARLGGHSALVFAAGVDDRITPRKPAYAFFHRHNVEACTRVLRLAQQAGIQRAVVLGSYFTYFNRLWPELRLAERHPYIRSRLEQEQAAVSIPGLEAVILELPYIFGGMPLPDWKSLWAPLVKYIRSSRTLFYMRGGSACITAKTVAQAVAGALEHGQAGACYPIGDENLSWPALLGRLANADGRQIHVITLSTWLLKVGLPIYWLLEQLLGREAGLDPRYFAALQTAETFIDPEPARQALGYHTGGLDQAFRETVAAS